jgi:hypothetical protein
MDQNVALFDSITRENATIECFWGWTKLLALAAKRSHHSKTREGSARSVLYSPEFIPLN